MTDLRSLTLSADPPVGWPTDKPWPPFGTGPTFPVPTEPDLRPVDNTSSWGPRFYALQPVMEKNEAHLRAYDAQGIEWGAVQVQKITDTELNFTMSQAAVVIRGELAVNKLENGLFEIKATLNRQSFTL